MKTRKYTEKEIARAQRLNATYSRISPSDKLLVDSVKAYMELIGRDFNVTGKK